MIDEERFADLIDQIYPPIVFGDLTYSPSEVLKAVDPVAFRIGAADLESHDEED